MQRDGIIGANKPEIQDGNGDVESGYEKGIFGRTVLLFKRIIIASTTEGAKWKRTAEGCIYKTEDEQRIRNHLSMAHRVKTLG